jgi:PAS domain S-box-containing protein
MTKPFKSVSKFLLVYGLYLTGIVLALSGGLNLYFNYTIQRRVVSNQQRLIASDAANKVKSFVESKIISLKAASAFGGLDAENLKNRKLVLGKLLGLDPSFRRFVFLNKRRKELVSISRLSELTPFQLSKNNADEAYREVSKGATYISPIYIDQVTNEPLMVLEVPVKNVFGDFEGAVAAEVNLKFLWDLVGEIRPGKKSLVYVVDRKGALIALEDIGRVLNGENFSRIEEVEQFIKHPDPYYVDDADITKGINGKYELTTFVGLGIPDWAVVVETPLEEAFSSIISIFWLTLLILFVSWCVAIAVANFLSKKITRPITILRDATLKVSRGDLIDKIEIESRSEIGQLADAFNIMVENLKATTVSRDLLARESEERRKAEEAKKESEWHFRSLFENMLNGFAYCKMLFENGKPRDFIFLHVNKSFEALTGLKDVAGKNVSEVVPGLRESDPGIFEIYGRVASTGKPETCECYMEAMKMWFSMSVYSPDKDYFVAVFDVITDRKSSEQALRESEERYRIQFEEAIDAMVLADAETGIIVDCNLSATKLFEKEKSEIIGRHQSTLHPPENLREGVSRTFKKHVTQGSSDMLEDQIITKSGQIRDVAIRANRMILNGKDILQGIFRDVTEQKKMENVIQAHYITLKNIIENTSDAIFSIDRMGRYTSFNQMHAGLMKTLYGVDIEMGRPLLEYILDPADAKKALENFQNVFRGERISESVFYGLEARERRFYDMVQNPIFDKDGQVIGATIFAHDVTEQKHLQESLMQSQKMEALGRVAGGIAHEINNPMGVILGFAQSIARRVEENNPLYLPLRSIEREAIRCKKLIVDLLTFSRTARSEPELMNLNNIINEALTFVETQAKVQSVEIIKAFDSNLPRITANRNKIEQVIVNLCNNAIDAMPAGGDITITTLASENAKNIILKVRDTGTGMPKEIIPKIFDPFFTTKDVGKGTGLGLSLCYEIVKEHKGSISVDSKEGEFSEFTVILPIIQPAV